MARIIGAAVAAACGLACATPLTAATTKAMVYHALPGRGVGGPAGRVVFQDARGGAQILVRLYGLPPGRHGFHAHQSPSCGAGVDGSPAGAAGGHYDPGGTGKHLGPMGAGHLGDLPAITVDSRGVARETLFAPHITNVRQLKGHSVVIHAGGDTYSDRPEPLGGGGARIACGVVG